MTQAWRNNLRICLFFCTFVAAMKHIRIISPSGAIENAYITRAKERLERWGHRVSVGTHAMGQCGRFSGTEAERLADLNDALADASVDVIMCSRGGYGLQEIVDKIVLPTREKDTWPLLVGFSDVTVLHVLMNLNGVASLHAPMCKALATWDDEDASLLALKRCLEGDMRAAAVPGKEDEVVIGGNLSVLYGLQGTPYSLNAIIDTLDEPPMLLLEDICERHYHIDRMMHNLRLSGVLNRVKGVIVGQFTDCDDDPRMGCTVQETIAQVASQVGCPVYAGLLYGHEDVNMPVRMGR